jgi:hypothetical protein
MIFGESANTTKKEDMATIKAADPKYSMPRWCPAGLTRSQKRKLQRLRAKESQEKEAEKIFNDTHPLYPPPQKKWRPKTIEEKQTVTKIENKTTLCSTLQVRQIAWPARPDNLHQARTVRPRSLDRPHHTRKPPTTCQHQWKRTTCWEKTWSTMRLLQNVQVWM